MHLFLYFESKFCCCERDNFFQFHFNLSHSPETKIFHIVAAAVTAQTFMIYFSLLSPSWTMMVN